MYDVYIFLCRNVQKTEDMGLVNRTGSESTEPTDASQLGVNMENNKERHYYEALQHQQRYTNVHENQGVVAGGAGVTASKEDVEYMELK